MADIEPGTDTPGPTPLDFPERSDADLCRLHESIATLHASRGDYRMAYEQLRSALAEIRSRPQQQPHIPEQLRCEVARLRKERAEAHEQSIRDSLTDSYNRRYLDQRLLGMLTAAGTRVSSVAVALLDLDWFKQVNDSYGHLVGDRVLQRVAELLRFGLPHNAFCARYGGEEFVLALPGVDQATAIDIVESARVRIENHRWSTIETELRVTFSAGIDHSTLSRTDRPDVAAQAQLKRADELLYCAKSSGRNAVAYRSGTSVALAGPAAGRRTITQVSLSR
ncbi:MAG: GGDEF domain-containing protein [Sciscionella sp.]